jgi:hypothetical protein
MYIRCLDCHSSTWLDRLDQDSRRQAVSCASCGRNYTLVVPEDLGSSQRDQYRRALSLAEEHGVDLPSAYSVLFGVMTLDEARGLRGRAVESFAKAATAQTTAARETQTAQETDSRRSAAAIRYPAGHDPEKRAGGKDSPPASDEPVYDPGFRQAVLEGHLTPEQASERGSRRRMATRISQMHNLPMKLALKVVDNRMSLQAALECRFPKAEAPPADAPPPGMTGWQQSAVALAGAAVLVAVTLYGVSLWNALSEEVQAVEELTTVTEERVAQDQETPRPQQVPAPPARAKADDEVTKDDEGQVLSVTGPDPQTVLLSYCRTASETNRFEPVELAPAVPPFPGTRLGVFRDFDRLESLFAIRIRQDSRSHRWKAGDGTRPISAFRAPDQPSDATRIPIATR